MLKTLKKISIIIFIIAMLFEGALFSGWENIFGGFVMLFGWLLLCVFVFKNHILQKHPLIFMVSFGMGLFYFYLPLIGTLFANRPLTYKFLLPIDTFIHQIIYILVYIIAFLLYTQSRFRPNLLRKILHNFKFYETPKDTQLWLMGFFGVIIFLYTKISIGLSHLKAQDVSILTRLLLPLISFIYAPILILFKGLYYRGFVNENKSNRKIYFYIIGLVIMSFLGNGRQFMISSIILFLLLYFFNGLSNNYSLKKILPFKKVLFGVVLFFVITGPLTKMGYAMLAVRGQRSDLSAIELFNKTFETYHKIDIDEFDKLRKKDNSIIWDEEYTGSIFLDRLCNLRIADMTIYLVEKAKVDKAEAREFFLNQVLAQFPTPFLRVLGIEINKFESDINYTVASYIVRETNGNDGGGKLVAAHTGSGIWLFGYFYPLFFIVIYFVLFYVLDSFTEMNKKGYSVLFLINIYFFFSFLNFKNGIFTDILFLFRPYIQMCVLYILMFHITRLLSFFFEKKQSRL